MSDKPFMVFDLRNFTRADLEDIANFHLQIFNVKNILELSEEKYFLDDFNAALTKTLHPVGDDSPSGDPDSARDAFRRSRHA